MTKAKTGNCWIDIYPCAKMIGTLLVVFLFISGFASNHWVVADDYNAGLWNAENYTDTNSTTSNSSYIVEHLEISDQPGLCS